MKITYKDFLEIQKLKKQGITRNEAVLKTKYTQYVIYKYWDMPEDVFLKEKDRTKSEYSKYRDVIVEIITENNTLPASVIYDRLKERLGDTERLASMNSFYRYLKDLKRRMGLSDKKISVRQMVEETPMGEEAQVDFGQYQMPNMYGGTNRVYFFCMVLSYSRMKYVYFLSEPFDSLAFAYAHELAFKYFDGRPKTILYDQDRTMVVSENCGNIIFTKEFDEYMRAAGFEARVCKPHDPNSKGKIENVVKFVKQNFLEGREYCGIDALNSQCLAWLDRTGNGKIHQATKKPPRELFAKEQPTLTRHQPIEINLNKIRVARVSDLYYITYKSNRYSVPPSKCNIGDRVRLEIEGNALHIIDMATDKKIVTHRLLKGKGKAQVDREIQVDKNYFAKAKEKYEGSSVVVKFIERIELTKPRYLKEQARLLHNIEKQYSKQDIISAIVACSSENRFCFTEVLSELLIQVGERNLKEIAPKRTTSRYRKLANYNLLTEADDGFI